jgi:hypothetical protein
VDLLPSTNDRTTAGRLGGMPQHVMSGRFVGRAEELALVEAAAVAHRLGLDSG